MTAHCDSYIDSVGFWFLLAGAVNVQLKWSWYLQIPTRFLHWLNFLNVSSAKYVHSFSLNRYSPRSVQRFVPDHLFNLSPIPLPSPSFFQKHFWSGFSFSFPFFICSAMGSPSVYIPINRDVFFHFNGLGNNNEVLDRFKLKNLNLKRIPAVDIWGRKWANSNTSGYWTTSREKIWHLCIVYNSVLSLFNNDVSAELKEMRAEQISHMLHTGTAMALHCQKDECMYPMFCPVLTDSIVSVGYVSGLATPKRYWRHGLVNPLRHKRCHREVLPRCRLSSM